MNPIDKIKPAVRAISAYTLRPYRTQIKINQNENPFDMPVRIKEEVLRRLSDRAWSRYPDFVPEELLETLAAFAGWKPDGVLAGNGSNELIQAALMVTVSSGARVLICEPTFSLYRQIITILGGEVVNVPLTENMCFDISAIREAALPDKVSVIILCSPNNPTGSLIDSECIRTLAKDFDGIIILDEAYHEFSGQTVVPLLEELDNLIVLRTFSKAMAMAGLRVGYLLSSPEITHEVHKGTLPYNINFFSVTAACVACRQYDLLKPSVDILIAERERVTLALASNAGVEPFPSRANFILLRLTKEPRLVFDELARKGILVRDVSRYPMLSDCLRISIGTPEENDRLIESLIEIFGRRQL